MSKTPEHERRAAEILASMPEDHRKNAARLGFVAIGLRKRGPSFESISEEITPAILEEELRLRMRQNDSASVQLEYYI
jgi:hypothetical protein